MTTSVLGERGGLEEEREEGEGKEEELKYMCYRLHMT